MPIKFVIILTLDFQEIPEKSKDHFNHILVNYMIDLMKMYQESRV